MSKTLDDIRDLLHMPGSGAYIMIVCPFHDDHNPSCKVDSRGYFCFGCSARGSLDYLHNKLVDPNYVPPPREPFKSPWWKWYDRYGSDEGICKAAHANILRIPLYGKYLERRGIANAVGDLLIGYLDKHFTFPIFDPSGKIVGMVARALDGGPTKYITAPGQEEMLYVPDWEHVTEASYAIVVYGIIDAITLFLLGYPAVTGSAGKYLPAKLLTDFRKPVFVVPDLGEEDAASNLFRYMGWRGNIVCIDYPEGTKDANDLLTHGHTKLLKETLDNAIVGRTDKRLGDRDRDGFGEPYIVEFDSP